MTARSVMARCPDRNAETDRGGVRAPRFVLAAVAALLALSSASAVASITSAEPPTGWRDLGVAVKAGGEGSWDAVLTGAFSPCAAVRFQGRYLLYYIGASGLRDDGGPANRALGVAIARDGRSFRKWRDNPVLTRQGGGVNREEEGIFSCAAVVADGVLWLWYSGLFQQGPEAVSSSILLARSGDGVHFEDLGTVVSYRDADVWNSGDELFPVGAWRDDEWHVLYVSKGGVGEWLVGLASGPRPGQLERTAPALDLRPAQVVGGGSVQAGLVPFIVGFEDRSILWFRVAGESLEATGSKDRLPRVEQLALLRDGSRWLGYGRQQETGVIRAFQAAAADAGK